jgi:short-subunit dehydrogenase
MAAETKTPYLSVYAGTKAFNDSLSRNLAVEFSHKIDILSLKPGYVKT